MGRGALFIVFGKGKGIKSVRNAMRGECKGCDINFDVIGIRVDFRQQHPTVLASKTPFPNPHCIRNIKWFIIYV